jgi:hypothetical protein
MWRSWVIGAKNDVFYEINNVNNTIGFNNLSTRYNSDITTHAEMDCVKKLAFKMSRSRKRTIETDLIVLQINKLGELKNSQPCLHCATELFKNKKIKIKNLYFSTSEGNIVRHDFKSWYYVTEHHISSGWQYRYKR